jgi:hypothetical protein
LILICTSVVWADTPKAATTILEGATKASKESKKPIWLIFDASW